MIAVIGDVHGRVRDLEHLYNRLFTRYDVEEVVMLGDLVDRGEHERETVDLVRSVAHDVRLVTLRGNHEDMMIDWLFGENRYPESIWLANGGRTTLASFAGEKAVTEAMLGEDMRDAMRDAMGERLDFFTAMQTHHVIPSRGDDYLAVHAGVRLVDASPEEQHEEAVEKGEPSPLFWLRGVDSHTERYRDMVIVHGHTPVLKLENGDPGVPFVNRLGSDIITINMDTGCVYGNALSAMLIDTDGSFTFEVVTCRDN